jgi:hypothetical protein
MIHFNIILLIMTEMPKLSFSSAFPTTIQHPFLVSLSLMRATGLDYIRVFDLSA